MVRFPIPPFIHGGSQWAVFQSLFGGGTLVMHPEFDGHEMWQIVERHKINLIFITGDAMARPMIDALIAGNPETGAYDLSSLYVIASSAALFSPALKDQFVDLFPNRLSPTRSARRRPDSAAWRPSPRASSTPVARA